MNATTSESTSGASWPTSANVDDDASANADTSTSDPVDDGEDATMMTMIICTDDRDCDDTMMCNGTEACIDGACVAGVPYDCADASWCTIDTCYEKGDGGWGCHFSYEHDRCGPGELCTATAEGCVFWCDVASCQGVFGYECGNCFDDDDDGLVDTFDPDCWGPCDNNEAGWHGNVPGNPPNPCLTVDCYFDADGLAGSDDCYWALTCDPLEPQSCAHDPDYDMPGAAGTCVDLAAEQSEQCLSFCLPLTPNGCDCFGCCEVPLPIGIVTVYLGSGEPPTCTIDVADDPNACHPCEQVPSCTNPCDPCELCLGKLEVPDDCLPEQQCPAGEELCGLPGQLQCPAGSYCVTGCCQPNP